MRALSLLSAAAYAAAQSQCAIRLISEYPRSAVTLSIGGQQLDLQTLHGVGTYVNFPCNSSSPFVVTAADGNTTSSFVEPDFDFTALTAFVAQAPGSPINLAILEDAYQILGDDPSTLEQCLFRVLNGAQLGVFVNGVTGECYNCSHPAIGFAYPGSYMDYNLVFCGVPYSVQVQATDLSFNSTQLFSFVEHGAYTLIVRSPSVAPFSTESDYSTTGDADAAFVQPVGDAFGSQDTGLMTMVTDVAGPWPYWPMITAPLILVGLSLTHWILGYIFVATGACDRIYESDVAAEEAGGKKGGKGASASETPVEVDIMSFLGWDKRIKKGVKAKQQAKVQAAASDALSQSLNSEYRQGLLSGDGGEAGGANAPTASGVATAASSSSAVVAAAPVTSKPRSAGRIRAIDTLRGLSLCFMIFVNQGGGAYMLLDHAKWNGLHLADLLFPTFVFTQGLSMAISFDGRRKRGASKVRIATEVLIRAIKLYFIGCFINNGTDLADWRLLGVLQYFAISYLIVGCLDTFVRPFGEGQDGKDKGPTGTGTAAVAPTGSAPSTTSSSSSGGGVFSAIYNDVLRYGLQWAVMLILGAVYLIIQYAMPVDGCPTGYIGPGGLADQGLYQGKNCTGGAHRAVDVAIFGPFHMYHNNVNGYAQSSATCSDAGMAYNCDVYDPEGVLGWISAAWMCFLGLQAGRVFVTLRDVRAAAAASPDAAVRRQAALSHVLRWLAWGIPIGLIGGALCGFAKETGVIPINKNLWSPSFVAVLAGLDFVILATLFLVVDVAKTWSGTPFCYVGMNSIVVYTGSEILGGYLPFAITAGPAAINHAQAMTSNVVGVSSWVVVARYLYLRKIFVNV